MKVDLIFFISKAFYVSIQTFWGILTVFLRTKNYLKSFDLNGDPLQSGTLGTRVGVLIDEMFTHNSCYSAQLSYDLDSTNIKEHN